MATGTKTAILTPRGLAALKAGEWASDPAGRGAGRLQARRTTSGTVSFYYRYTATNGARVRIPLGVFDSDGRDGLTLADARKRAGALSVRYQDGERDLRVALAEEDAAVEREREARRHLEEAEAARRAGTLGALLSLYVRALKDEGKPSADAVEAAVKRHVKDKHPKLWAKPAVDVIAEDGVALVGPLAHAGKLREAAKLRSYIRAAFSMAVRSHTDAKASPDIRKLGVRSNPFAELATIEGSNRVRERALSVDELRAYWKRIAAMSDADGALLRFHLLTGCQRIEQLARVTMDDYDSEQSLIVLRDIKGRRREPRIHAVPLIPAAVEALEVMRKPVDAASAEQDAALRPYLFTVTAGEAGAVYSVVRYRLLGVVDAMQKAKELEKGAFTPGALRRTVETRLAAVSVSKEVRGHLQSHGLGGVQARHYDRHDYLVEKRNSLSQLYELVTGRTAKVTPIKRKAG